MSYNANLDIVISLASFKTHSFRKQGLLRFRLSLSHADCQSDALTQKKHPQIKTESSSCHLYNILKSKALCHELEYDMVEYIRQPQVQASHQLTSHAYCQHSKDKTHPNQTVIAQQLEKDSYIDHDLQHYYSRVFEAKNSPLKNEFIQESLFFRTHIPSDIFLEKCDNKREQFIIRVELLHAIDLKSDYQQIGNFTAKIYKSNAISTFLPIVFDEFEGFVIEGVYQSTIMEFKFENEQHSEMFYNFEGKKAFLNFQEYLSSATNSFSRQKIASFYDYYYQFLEKELFHIQNTHSDLLRVLNFKANYAFVKINQGPEFYRWLDEICPNENMLVRKKSWDSMGINVLNNGSQKHVFGGSQCYVGMKPSKDEVGGMVVDHLTHIFLNLKKHIYLKWNQLIIFSNENMKAVVGYYKRIYDSHVKDRYQSHVFSHKIQNSFDWTYSKYQDSGKISTQQAQMDKLKEKDQEMWREIFPIENLEFFDQEQKNIKIFEEVFEVQNSSIRNSLSLGGLTHRSTSNTVIGYEHEFNRKLSTQTMNPLTVSSVTSVHQEHLIGHFQDNPPRNNQKYFTQHSNQMNQLNFVPHTNILLNQQKLPFSQKQIRQDFHQPKIPSWQMPLPFEQFNQQHKQENKYENGEHIIVLVHGYQASRQDFILLKNCLQIRYKCRAFISSCNEGRTQESIESLGKRLAVELTNYFKNIEFTNMTRLSFVGHSMGGIIIRCALSYIKNLQKYLYTYISFSSPHLGYLYEPSVVIQAGLWFLNAWQKSQSLDQICMREKSDPRKCLLYRLSESKSLNNFKNIALISSSQDEYVPYESARIEKNSHLLETQLSNSINRTVICEMADSLLADIHCRQISRINVVFNIQDKNFDSLVGRTAHVKYLSDQKFIKMFCIVFDKFFA